MQYVFKNTVKGDPNCPTCQGKGWGELAAIDGIGIPMPCHCTLGKSGVIEIPYEELDHTVDPIENNRV